MKRKITAFALSITAIAFLFTSNVFAADYSIVFGNTPPSIVNFNSPLSTTSTSGFAAVNSKWNQPRAVGTNPHNGVDLKAALNTNVYAPYDGWATGILVQVRMTSNFWWMQTTIIKRMMETTKLGFII